MAGDAHWAEQQYQLALQQYKTAAGAARDLATPYLRQGMALIATRRYDLAADAFVRALDVDDAVPDSDFRLDTLYGDLRLAKNSHLESLAGRALENPDDARMLFVLGVFLHFDGEPERAVKFFRKSAELSGGMAPYARLFLRAALVDEPVEGEAAGLGI
jgi:tetratricopeptide (TPR) repeat protein